MEPGPPSPDSHAPPQPNSEQWTEDPALATLTGRAGDHGAAGRAQLRLSSLPSGFSQNWKKLDVVSLSLPGSDFADLARQ